MNLGTGPHPCLVPPSSLTFLLGFTSFTLHLASQIQPCIISMHLLRTPGGAQRLPLDFTVSCLGLLSHYSDVGSGSPRLSSFIFMHLGPGITPSS